MLDVTTTTQLSIDDLGRSLHDVTFCVVDLETTGGSASAGHKITEIGAVKVRGGEVLGEFQTLVNPDESIPAFITVLTGITDAMVIHAPRIAEVLPSFLEFAHGSVLVAHNAPFDTGFLRHAARGLDIAWPRFEVVDTAVLARRALLRDEAPNVKLGTLARIFSTSTTPDHRALHDARATVDVLHGLFDRLGSLGVRSLEDVQSFTSRTTPEQRRKRHLAEHIPQVPGVYVFRDANDAPLYVGTSRRLRSRVRSYFTEAETRSRMGDMVRLAQRVEAIECATTLEAQVREVRLIAASRPPYNRRSKFPDRLSWVKLTSEPWPRLSIVREVKDDGADYIGPFGRRAGAESAVEALHAVFTIRQCRTRLARRSRRGSCALAELGRCLSPCDGSADEQAYAHVVDAVRRALTGTPSDVVDHAVEQMGRLSRDQRFEEAAAARDRLMAFLRGAERSQRLRALAAEPEIVAAAPTDTGWDVHVIRHGSLAAAGRLPRTMTPRAYVEHLTAAASTVEPRPLPLPAQGVEECELIERWLHTPGLRVARGAWSHPWPSAAGPLAELGASASSRGRHTGSTLAR